MPFGEAELRLLNSVGAYRAKLIGAVERYRGHLIFNVPCTYAFFEVSSLDRDFCHKDSLPCSFSQYYAAELNCNQSTQVQLQHNPMVGLT